MQADASRCKHAATVQTARRGPLQHEAGRLQGRAACAATVPGAALAARAYAIR